MKEWYDGYQFGNAEVYCPWDVVNYVDRLQDRENLEPQNYWVNTSGNDAVRYLIGKMGNGVLKSEMESLIAGETVEKDVREDLTYGEIYATIDHVWSLLFMTGYLTQRGTGMGNRLRLAIPNLEIRSIFTSQSLEMFQKEVVEDGALLKAFCDALEEGKAEEVESLFKDLSGKDDQYPGDVCEASHEGEFLSWNPPGILGYRDGWHLKSNQESGNGYSDIMIRDLDEDIGIIIEVKYAQDGNMERVCREAIEQIDRNEYGKELQEEGCHTILKYGISCYRKGCRVLVEKEEAQADT